jgi:hypothetical protein
MMNPSSPQYATLGLDSGLITNASSLGLTTPGVATGRVGLPISAHQLGFIPPGGQTFTALEAGDSLLNNPEYTFSLAISHRIQNGPLKGLSFGANGSLQLDCPLFYATQLNGSRILYKRSDIFNHGAYIGYEFKLGRNLRLRSQLHCSNLFDTQKVDIRPAAAGGAPRLAAPLYTPRLITWSNTLSF